jgi:hypothetical protein
LSDDSDRERLAWGRAARDFRDRVELKTRPYRAARWGQLLRTFVFPIAFHRLYQPLNEAWTVKTFGCSCPTLDGRWRFNANHFNSILWLIIAAICVTSLIAGCRPVRSSEDRSVLLIWLIPLMFGACLMHWALEGWM